MENQDLSQIVNETANIAGIVLSEVKPLWSPKRYEGENDKFKMDYDAGSEKAEVFSIYRKAPVKGKDSYIAETLSVAKSIQSPELSKISFFVDDFDEFLGRYSHFLKEKVEESNPFLYKVAHMAQMGKESMIDDGVFVYDYKNDEDIKQAVNTFVNL